ncbi:DUF305 domain-containing protein [Nonomuraea sp. NPDC026600]|uniref:DUF305 domain-containing protein n=1 Tax=Nonomuraea sp. NPDC026600 TaxID=3155363 RepID=UPI0033F1F0B6
MGRIALRVRTLINRTASYTAATGALALLTACGGTGMTGHEGMSSAAPVAATAARSPSANGADVMFTQMMIPHHEQAVEMAGLAASRVRDVQIKELAAKIKTDQEREIGIMKGWLTAWGKPEMAGHMGHEMPGLLSEKVMKQLESAKGQEFDKLFVQGMIAHHNGAVEMARTEQTDGADPEVKKMAAHMVIHQRGEVALLQEIGQRL